MRKLSTRQVCRITGLDGNTIAQRRYAELMPFACGLGRAEYERHQLLLIEVLEELRRAGFQLRSCATLLREQCECDVRAQLAVGGIEKCVLRVFSVGGAVSGAVVSEVEAVELAKMSAAAPGVSTFVPLGPIWRRLVDRARALGMQLRTPNTPTAARSAVRC